MRNNVLTDREGLMVNSYDQTVEVFEIRRILPLLFRQKLVEPLHRVEI